MAGMCGAAGIPAKFEAVEADIPVRLAIIHCEKPLTRAAMQNINESWKRMRDLSPDLPPCVVMENGLRLELQ